MKGVGQQHRNHHGPAAATSDVRENVTDERLGLLQERGVHVEAGAQPTDPPRERVGDGRGPGIRAAVGGEDQGVLVRHDACSPHSVFVWPAQRPLRGSAPSTGFAVHGAHPMDGYPSKTSGLTSTSLASM